MILIRSYSDILHFEEKIRAIFESDRTSRKRVVGSLWEEAEEGCDDSQQHTKMAIMEVGDIDLKPVGLLGGLCEQWLEFVELFRPEGPQVYYRIGILADNEYFVLLYAAQKKPGIESWLSEQIPN